MRRVLFVDGSNLFGGISELLKPNQYIDFLALLAAIETDLPVEEVRFYGTYMRIDPLKSAAYRLRVGAQKAFFDGVKDCPKVRFFKGHFSGAGKEKGVDVQLAVDMALGACTNEYDEAVIMTGDADLKYGVEMAKKHGKVIHMAAFGSRFPFGIVSLANKKYVYDLNGFFQKSVLPIAKSRPKGLEVRELNGKVSILTKK